MGLVNKFLIKLFGEILSRQEYLFFYSTDIILLNICLILGGRINVNSPFVGMTDEGLGVNKKHLGKP